jgi:hypothetical protein
VLALKKLVNRALEGDARSAAELLALRTQAERNYGAKNEKIRVEDWVPDFEGQTGEQKTRARARENETDPIGYWERAGSVAWLERSFTTATINLRTRQNMQLTGILLNAMNTFEYILSAPETKFGAVSVTQQSFLRATITKTQNTDELGRNRAGGISDLPLK